MAERIQAIELQYGDVVELQYVELQYGDVVELQYGDVVSLP